MEKDNQNIEANRVFAEVPELLVPVGNMEKLETAIAYGADAVYLGGEDFNLRASASGFSLKELQKAVKLAKENQVRVYYCLNSYIQNSQINDMEEHLIALANLVDEGIAPDGLIVADMGVANLARIHCKNIPLHISTQANVCNSMAAKLWQDLGAVRVNVAREVSYEEMSLMKVSCRNMELEVFVHGAMCMAISGRCFMSAWLNSRSANQGACTHPCRFDYKPIKNQNLFLEEGIREDTPVWELEEGEKYSRIFAAHDMCLMEHLPKLAALKVSAIKIEGRTKSSSYLAQVTRAYRWALDDLKKGSFDSTRYMPELINISTRPLSTGFFENKPNIAFAEPTEFKKPILARVVENLGKGRYKVSVKSAWKTEDDVSILFKEDTENILKKGEYSLLSVHEEPVDFVGAGLDAILVTDTVELKEHIFLRTI